MRAAAAVVIHPIQNMRKGRRKRERNGKIRRRRKRKAKRRKLVKVKPVIAQMRKGKEN